MSDDQDKARRPSWAEIEALYERGSHKDNIPPRAVTGLVDPPAELPIPFDPVPRLRNRRGGWTEATQRAFIAALSQCGCVARAARSVGLTPRSAYRLLGSPGADSFAEAWDQAIAYGAERLRDEAMTRALLGSWVPVVRRGRVVRQEFRYNDRLAVALLGGGLHGTNIEKRERATSRRRYRLFLAEHRELEEERKRQAEEAAEPPAPSAPPPAEPRVRRL